jgi:hypothetical protein
LGSIAGGFEADEGDGGVADASVCVVKRHQELGTVEPVVAWGPLETGGSGYLQLGQPPSTWKR